MFLMPIGTLIGSVICVVANMRIKVPQSANQARRTQGLGILLLVLGFLVLPGLFVSLAVSLIPPGELVSPPAVQVASLGVVASPICIALGFWFRLKGKIAAANPPE